MRDVERLAGVREDRELTGLGAEPDPILAAVGVDLRVIPTTRDELSIEPREAVATGSRRTRRNAPLPGRYDHDACTAPTVELQHLRALPQQTQIVVVGRSRRHCASLTLRTTSLGGRHMLSSHACHAIFTRTSRDSAFELTSRTSCRKTTLPT